MSRFLSRPPPSSCWREDVSLIGSIKKPQNEKGKVNQRREITRAKNEKGNRKRSREVDDKLHYLEDINNKRRYDKRVKFNESCRNATKGEADLLEKSDLSEEHDPPAFVLKQCYSLGSSTQSSSNNLRDTDPNRKKQGLVLRIKLPSTKPKAPETASVSSEPCSSLQVSKSSNIQVGLRDSGLQRKNALLVQKHKRPETASTSTEIHGSLQVTKSSNILLALLDCGLQRKNAPLVQKLKDQEQVFGISEPSSSSKATKSSNNQVFLPDYLLQRKNVLVQPLPANEDPCFSGRAAQAPPITSESHLSESSHESSRRHGKHGGHRARKSEKLFRDLILNWKAPPLEVVETDADDQDWLFTHRQPKPTASHSCRAVVPEPNVFQRTEGSLQPRACYVPELDTFQLPYVIPF